MREVGYHKKEHDRITQRKWYPIAKVNTSWPQIEKYSAFVTFLVKQRGIVPSFEFRYSLSKVQTWHIHWITGHWCDISHYSARVTKFSSLPPGTVRGYQGNKKRRIRRWKCQIDSKHVWDAGFVSGSPNVLCLWNQILTSKITLLFNLQVFAFEQPLFFSSFFTIWRLFSIIFSTVPYTIRKCVMYLWIALISYAQKISIVSCWHFLFRFNYCVIKIFTSK